MSGCFFLSSWVVFRSSRKQKRSKCKFPCRQAVQPKGKKQISLQFSGCSRGNTDLSWAELDGAGHSPCLFAHVRALPAADVEPLPLTPKYPVDDSPSVCHQQLLLPAPAGRLQWGAKLQLWSSSTCTCCSSEETKNNKAERRRQRDADAEAEDLSLIKRVSMRDWFPSPGLPGGDAACHPGPELEFNLHSVWKSAGHVFITLRGVVTFHDHLAFNLSKSEETCSTSASEGMFIQIISYSLTRILW